MDFRFGGDLPDDHVFRTRIRHLVDWCFKFVSWLGVTATFGVAAEITNNRWLWGIYIFCHILLIFFLQSFFSWMFAMQFSKKRQQRTTSKVPASGFGRWMIKFRTITISVFAFLVWVGFQVAIQNAIGHTVEAIGEFQKSGRAK